MSTNKNNFVIGDKLKILKSIDKGAFARVY